VLTGVHVLLTYRCTHECKHCFVFSGPQARGTFTRENLVRLLDQAHEMHGVQWIYFEGGEPFLYYPLLLEGLRAARDRGFRTGVVTNGFWAESAEDALLWLRPLKELGVEDLSISDDAFHRTSEQDRAPSFALEAAKALEIPAAAISIPDPKEHEGVRFRGRAARELTADLPREPWDSFRECPYEPLAAPERVHVDPMGNVHLCQGLLLGNCFETPLLDLLATYEPQKHPICGPILRGGPAALAEETAAAHEETYVSACHLCDDLRSRLRKRFPTLLGPPQVYGHAH
jgi:MoaA/NifB/PqqE/SkfB family radical SAM enzyme